MEGKSIFWRILMKKYLWLIALFAAFLLVFSGCGGNPGDDDDDGDKEETRGVPIDGTEAWWVAPSQIGRDRKYPDNTVPVLGEDDDASYIHIFWNPHGINLPDNRTFEVTIVLEYFSDYFAGVDMMWQCAFDPYGTWARSSGPDDYFEMVFPDQIYTAKVQPGRIFTGSNWDETKWGNGKTQLTIPEMTGLCIQIPIEYEWDAGYVKIHNVSFANNGLGPEITGPHPPAN